MNNHLTAQQMLKYVDGELSKSEMSSTEEHLHSCWTCLAEVERLKEGIVTILDAHNEHFAFALPPPPRPWPSFEELLVRKLPEKPDTLLGRLADSLNMLLASARILAASGLVVVLLVSGYAFFHVQTVSAKEILRRIQAADVQRSVIKNDQVIRERVHIRKTTRARGHVQLASVETWKSPTAAYWSTEESDPAATDLKAQYQAHAIPGGLPLSAAAIGSWGKAAGGNPTISREGSDVDLSFVGEEGNSESQGVERVTLVVESETWRVKRMTLDIADESFEVTEEDYSVISKRELPANLLALLEPVAPATLNPSREVPALSDVTSNAIHLPLANLDKAQLDVFLKLHNLKADLGEPLTVTRTSQAVEVGIWQLPADRQDELRDAFTGEAGVQLELTAPRTPLKQEGGASPPSPLPSTDTPLPDQIESGGDDQHLMTYFGTPEREQDFTNEALGTNTAILSHLYALRNLGAQFSEDKSRVLTPEEQKQLRSLVQDHVTAIASSLDALIRQLYPLTTSFGVLPCASSETAVAKNWQSGAAETLRTARVIDHLLRAVFTTSQTPVAPGSALPQIEQNVCHLRSDLKSLDEHGIY